MNNYNKSQSVLGVRNTWSGEGWSHTRGPWGWGGAANGLQHQPVGMGLAMGTDGKRVVEGSLGPGFQSSSSDRRDGVA